MQCHIAKSGLVMEGCKSSGGHVVNICIGQKKGTNDIWYFSSMTLLGTFICYETLFSVHSICEHFLHVQCIYVFAASFFIGKFIYYTILFVLKQAFPLPVFTPTIARYELIRL